VLLRIREIIGGNRDYRLRMSPEDVTMDTRFREDLGFDSIALMSLVYELQETYPELDELIIAKWRTVSDCVRTVEGLGS
jgi:acyl carrier protein